MGSTVSNSQSFTSNVQVFLGIFQQACPAQALAGVEAVELSPGIG